MEGLRIVGDPYELANKYYESGVDEIVLIDAVASLYQRESILRVVARTAENIFIPITVGGGIRTLENAKQLFSCGADKIAINSAAISNPALITEIAGHFGTQSVVVSIDAKRVDDGWEVYINNGREPTGLEVGNWMQKVKELGAGEVLLSSVDRDGTKKGMDIDLFRHATDRCQLPIIGSSGIGSLDDAARLFDECDVNALAIGSALHSGTISVVEVKKILELRGLEVRQQI